MGASLWDQVWLPLLIGLAIQIIVAALCFLSARLSKYLIKTQTARQIAVRESAHNQQLPDGDAAAQANAVPDLEMGNHYGPAEGGHFMAESELELGIVNSGEALKAQVTGVAARRVLVPVEMDVPHSQQEEVAA